jgi:hypothetical protein
MNDQGIGEKIAGIKEQVKGKITKNPDLVEHGQLRRTGELQKREAEEKVSSYLIRLRNHLH